MNFLEDLKAQFHTYYDALIAFIPKFVIAIIILTIFLYSSRWLRKKVIKFLHGKADDPLLVNFINSLFRIINIVAAVLLFLYIIDKTEIASKILGAAGISAFVIGFAFRDLGENFLAGVIMAFNRPFRVGDTIETAGSIGSVIEMNLRETHIKSFDGKDIYIPNGQILKNPLLNYTIDGFIRKQFTIGVGYNSDIDQVRTSIYNTLTKIPGILTEEKSPSTVVADLGTSSININVYYWLNTFDKNYSGADIQSQAMNDVIKTLEQQGVSLPGQVIELKNVS